MGERSQVPACSDRAAARNTRQEAAVEAFDHQLDRLDPRAGVALRQSVRAQEHRGPHDLVRIGLTDSARVATEKAHLELVRHLFGNPLRDEPAEAGVDAVGVLLLPVGRPGDELARCTHAAAGRVRELRLRTLDRDRPDVVDRQVVAREGARVDHATSVVRDCPG